MLFHPSISPSLSASLSAAWKAGCRHPSRFAFAFAPLIADSPANPSSLSRSSRLDGASRFFWAQIFVSIQDSSMAPRWFSKERHSHFDGGGGDDGVAEAKSSPAVILFFERLLLRLGDGGSVVCCKRRHYLSHYLQNGLSGQIEGWIDH